MSAINTTTMADAIKTQYERRLMTRALPRLIFNNFGDRPTLTQNGTYELRKYGSLSANTTPLTEGTTPAETQAAGPTKVTITPTFYGTWMGYNDQVSLEVFDPVISVYSALLGEQAGLSADTIVRDVVIGNASIVYSGDATSVGVLEYPTHRLSARDIIKLYAVLETEGAMPLIGSDYVLILHPHSFAELMLDPMWVNMFNSEIAAGKDNPYRSGMVGKFLQMVVYITGNQKEWADVGYGSTTDVYAATILAKEAFGVLGLTGAAFPRPVDTAGPEGTPLTNKNGQIKPVELIVKAIGSAGSADPLNQRGTIAWKMCLTPKVLNSAWVYTMKHTNAFSNQ